MSAPSDDRPLADRIEKFPRELGDAVLLRCPREWRTAPRRGHDLDLPGDEVLAFSFLHALCDALAEEHRLDADGLARAEAVAGARTVARHLSRLHSSKPGEAFARVWSAADEAGVLLSEPVRSRPPKPAPAPTPALVASSCFAETPTRQSQVLSVSQQAQRFCGSGRRSFKRVSDANGDDLFVLEE